MTTDIYILNLFGTPLSRGKAETIIARIDAAYEAGVRRIMVNIAHDDMPAMLAKIGPLLRRWMATHPDCVIGPYVRTRGNPADWPKSLYAQWKKIVTPWIKAGIKCIGVDHSAGHDATLEFLSRQPVPCITEPHGDMKFPLATLGLARYMHNKYGGIKAAPTGKGKVERVVWVSEHFVRKGQPAWEAEGMTREQYVATARRKGFTIASADVAILRRGG